MTLPDHNAGMRWATAINGQQPKAFECTTLNGSFFRTNLGRVINHLTPALAL
jgi:hypothetical protein